jgi:hypothetical protein
MAAKLKSALDTARPGRVVHRRRIASVACDTSSVPGIGGEHRPIRTAVDAKKVRHAMEHLAAGNTRPWSKVKHDLGL